MIGSNEFKTLKDVLLTLKGELFYFLPNPGNAGDAAIYIAALKLFDSIGLSYRIITDLDIKLEKKTIVVGGGGALSTDESSLAKKIKAASLLAKRVIVLPHTAREINSTLNESKAEIMFFCREQRTFEYIKHFKNVTSLLVHDLVFSLNLEDYKELESHKNHFELVYLYARNQFFYRQLKFRLRDLGKALRASSIVRKLLNSQANNIVLNAFRLDEESSSIGIPTDNLDISSLFQISINEPTLAEISTRMMVHFISQFQVVNTNRLHVAIIAAQLGKKVYFYDNSYFKCREVYIHSIESNFKDVEFIKSDNDF